MIPKLEEAFAPLAAGVGAVHIVGAGEIAARWRRPGASGRCSSLTRQPEARTASRRRGGQRFGAPLGLGV